MAYRSKKRDALIETAEELFYQFGFHAVGIDRIIAESQVAKMTLYKHFPSKDDLIETVLTEASKRVVQWLETETDRLSLTDEMRIDALFDAHEAWFREHNFKGCLFARACAEYPDADNHLHQVAERHFRTMFKVVEKQASLAGAKDPANAAENLMVLLEGAKALAFAASAPIAARRAKRVARLQMKNS